ncbi:MAG: TlpA family protein disulfide reductase [Fimbriimonadaceae bacterium]
MIGMNADTDESVADVAKQIKGHQVNWRQGMLRDDSSLRNDYDVTGFPTKVLIGKDGVVRFIDNFITKEQLVKLIKAG